jgi:preprotein translocase subunit SecG
MWDFIWRWETLYWLMILAYVPMCLGLIVVVLLQKGKGTGFAGAFGLGGGSDPIFGPGGGKTLIQRLTTGMAIGFMILALAISMISGKLGKGAAPDLAVVEDTIEEASPLTDELEKAGIGTGADDAAAAVKEAPAPATEAPAVEAPAEAEAGTAEAPPATEAPAAVEPAVADEAPAEEGGAE